jgi:hypothetical protein
MTFLMNGPSMRDCSDHAYPKADQNNPYDRFEKTSWQPPKHREQQAEQNGDD